MQSPVNLLLHLVQGFASPQCSLGLGCSSKAVTHLVFRMASRVAVVQTNIHIPTSKCNMALSFEKLCFSTPGKGFFFRFILMEKCAITSLPYRRERQLRLQEAAGQVSNFCAHKQLQVCQKQGSSGNPSCWGCPTPQSELRTSTSCQSGTNRGYKERLKSSLCPLA